MTYYTPKDENCRLIFPEKQDGLFWPLIVKAWAVLEAGIYKRTFLHYNWLWFHNSFIFGLYYRAGRVLD